MNLLKNHYKSYLIISALLAILLFTQRIELIAFAAILIYWTGIKIFTLHENKFVRSLAFILVLLFSIGLVFHKIPGFHNILFFDKIKLSIKSSPYSAYINFDKPFLALLLFYYYNKRKLYKIKFASALIYGLLLTIIAVSTLAILSIYADFIKFDPKIPKIIWIWIPMNIAVVIAEEACSRGFIQTSLMYGLRKCKISPAYAGFIAITLVSILFGIGHYFTGGPTYMLISGIAGLFYGYALYKTRMIETSFLVHFLVNLIHICLFTYPSLVHTP